MSMRNLGQIPVDKAYLFSNLALLDTVYMVKFILMCVSAFRANSKTSENVWHPVLKTTGVLSCRSIRSIVRHSFLSTK